MTDRRGVLLLFFDIPNVSREEQRRYRKFRKAIKKDGYACMQESVYAKLVKNTVTSGTEINKIRDFAPLGASVAVLPLSLMEFSKMKNVCGMDFNYSLFCDDIVYL